MVRWSRSSVTDAKGEFSVEAFTATPRLVEVIKDGYLDMAFPVATSPCVLTVYAREDIRRELKTLGGPMGAEYLRCLHALDPPWLGAETLDALLPRVQAIADGRESHALVTPELARQALFLLSPPRPARGTVSDAEGRPLAGIPVYYGYPYVGGDHRMTTDAEGRFETEPLRYAGGFLAVVDPSGARAPQMKEGIEGGRAYDFTLTTNRARLAGVATDAQGRPLPQCRITAVLLPARILDEEFGAPPRFYLSSLEPLIGESPWAVTTTSGPEGRFELGVPPASRAQPAFAEKEGYLGAMALASNTPVVLALMPLEELGDALGARPPAEQVALLRRLTPPAMKSLPVDVKKSIRETLQAISNDAADTTPSAAAEAEGLLRLLNLEACPLEANDYAGAFSAFAKEMDAHYPFFDLKGIRGNWEAAKVNLAAEAAACTNDAEFMRVMLAAILVLRDGHMHIADPRVEPAFPETRYGGVSFHPATEDRVVVMESFPELAATLPPGTVVTKVNGSPARAWFEEQAESLWEKGGYPSRQRARLFAYRYGFRWEEGDFEKPPEFEIEYVPAGTTEPATLKRTADRETRGWPHAYALPPGLREGPGVFHAVLSNGYGYAWCRRMQDEAAFIDIVKGFQGAPGLIVDLRGCGGGGGGRASAEAIKALNVPVVGLIDAGTYSAGETFARDLAQIAGACLMGSTTAGASSSKRHWPLPNGFGTVVYAERSRWGIGGRPIEYNGIEPDETVEIVPEELQQGLNSGILRASERLDRVRQGGK